MKISKSKNKEIHALIIGDEILSGKREDKHLRHLIKVLKAHNFQLSRADYVSDAIKKKQENVTPKGGDGDPRGPRPHGGQIG